MAQLNSKNGYSFEETCIGTWVDGKPLYRKTIKQDVDWSDRGTTYTVHRVNYNIQNCKNIVCAKILMANKTNNASYAIPYIGSDGTIISFISAINSGGFNFYNLKGDWSNSSVVVSIEYTKTTD